MTNFSLFNDFRFNCVVTFNSVLFMNKEEKKCKTTMVLVVKPVIADYLSRRPGKYDSYH